SNSRISTAVYRWEVLSGKALPALDGHQEGASCVAFAPDGKTLVVADAKNTYRWELPGGKLLGRTPRAGGQAPRAFSPDRTSLAADDAGGAGLWEVDTGKKLRQLEQPRRGGEDTVSGVDPAFSPDGKTVAGGDYNIRMGPQGSTLGGILLWNTATG